LGDVDQVEHERQMHCAASHVERHGVIAATGKIVQCLGDEGFRYLLHHSTPAIRSTPYRSDSARITSPITAIRSAHATNVSGSDSGPSIHSGSRWYVARADCGLFSAARLRISRW